MFFESLWLCPAAALAAALVWAGLFRRKPALAGLALPLGALIGVTLMLGVVNGSPRQLAERVPMVALAALILAAPLAFVALRWIAAALTALAALACGWWMGGAPTDHADLLRAAPVILAFGLIVPLAMIGAAASWMPAASSLALPAGLWAAGFAGPWTFLALILAAAACGQQIACGGKAPKSARLPLAMLLAALLSGPILARGAPADWAVSLAPLALLLLALRLAGPRLAGDGA
ncbi:MAG: hypothetical protein JWR10_3353 [Rubritepida sp.]|nr:hypothetical protein [Rubritepida sp.]